MADLVPAEAVSTAVPGGPATDAGSNREGPKAHAEKAKLALADLVRELRQGGQTEGPVLQELERMQQTLSRVCDSLHGTDRSSLRQAVRGRAYGMRDAGDDMMRDIRNGKG